MEVVDEYRCQSVHSDAGLNRMPNHAGAGVNNVGASAAEDGDGWATPVGLWVGGPGTENDDASIRGSAVRVEARRRGASSSEVLRTATGLLIT